MKKETKVLLVDDNVQQRQMLLSYFQGQEDIKVVGVASDGLMAWETLERHEVDVMLMDLILPHLDGFGVMEKMLEEMDKPPKVIVLSALSQEHMIRKSCELGAQYYMVKPIDIETLHKRIIEITSKPVVSGSSNSQNGMSIRTASNSSVHGGMSLDERITSVFLIIGIPAHIKGYHYLREGIKLVMSNPDIINRITKELYPSIARQFSATPSKVERAIRHAIEVAWSRGKIENINQIFGYNIYGKNDKPTNGEFIALVADKLLMEKERSA